MKWVSFVGAAALLLSTAVTAQEARLDPESPEDSLKIARKIACSLEDGEAVTYWWEGRAWSRRQGERDRLLFLVEGMNVRACVADEDDKRGKGYRLVSRELLLYKDPKTGEVLATWDNPWTGETVDVFHVANDPVNFASYETGRDGKPATWPGEVLGRQWRQTTTVPLFYPNPLGGKYQAEVGGTYHATEMFNFFGRTDDLLDPSRNTAEVHVGWVRMSAWLPWMKMGGRDGHIYFHTAGHKLASPDQLSDTMKAEIAEHYPDYAAPPPLDDRRPNVTSWIYYKRVTEGDEKAPERR